MACVRCGRDVCRADELVEQTKDMLFPEAMRGRVTDAQDECDFHQIRPVRRSEVFILTPGAVAYTDGIE